MLTCITTPPLGPNISQHLDQSLAADLAERQAALRYRSRRTLTSPQGAEVQINGRVLINFCSNDYLGLANHPKLREAAIAATRRLGTSSGASHLVCGHNSEHHQLEEELAAFTQRPRALVFSTGYMANIGCIGALLRRRDAIFEDKLNHASLLDAGLLSGAKLQRFAHHDIQHLKRHLESSDASRKLIAVDSVFSMDGDIAPLEQLARLAQHHHAWLMVDDAHGFGCLGQNGRGTLEVAGLDIEKAPILMATLGKALGSFGAFIAGSETLIESLIQFARTYIYTTALPPGVAAASRAGLHMVQAEPERRIHLAALIQQFVTGAHQIGLPLLPSSTAIQPLMLGSDKRALAMQQALEQKGLWISAIRPPTVPEGSARLRITLSAAHSHDQVNTLLAALQDSWRNSQL